ncbi:hypothetical protein ACU686_21835 [Yinghuangia aomiensis]
MQPLLLVFVFLYVFPTIGQGIGGSSTSPGESGFATVLVPGVVAISIMFQGIQSVAIQMSQEFGYTREIEDRVQAPCPIWLVAVARVLSGSCQALILGGDRVSDRGGGACAGGAAGLACALADRGDDRAAGVLAMTSAGAGAGDVVRAAEHRADVRVRGAAVGVPRRHVLPVDLAVARACGGFH